MGCTIYSVEKHSKELEMGIWGTGGVRAGDVDLADSWVKS